MSQFPKYLGVNAVKAKATEAEPVRHGERPWQPDFCHVYRLIAILNNGVWQIAADVTDMEVWKKQYAEYARGMYLTMDYYWLPATLVPECPDEGRAPASIQDIFYVE